MNAFGSREEEKWVCSIRVCGFGEAWTWWLCWCWGVKGSIRAAAAAAEEEEV